MIKNLFLTFPLLLLAACSGDTPETTAPLYFPPNNATTWETVTPGSLGWNTREITGLLTLLEENGTRGFIVLKDGKIVIEEYFGRNLAGGNNFNSSSNWYWASAGKTLTASLVGIAQSEGFLSINDKTSKFLGRGWTSLTPQKEELITVRHQLAMTTGLDDGVTNNHAFSKENLVYKADAGTRWAYHNGPYTLLDQVIKVATGRELQDYFEQKIGDRIGMDGTWQWIDNNHVYFSNARSMARFGLLVLNKGTWNNETILYDTSFFNEMVSTSQSLNKSYGYLWWLNGKESFLVPGSQLVIPGSISPAAPPDMVSGMGKNGQYVSIIPSKGIVMVRMGESPDNVPVPFMFMDEIWKKLSIVIN